ncbi:MAG: cysteine desulfurase [Fimbriimonadaceae bacterium]|nr:cysteine desulfurase [Fimbriimonadaceae bacterium]
MYLDYAATTPLLPEAAAAMQPWLQSNYGNPSSLHAEGRRAKDAIDEAREIVSTALGCLFAEVIFTSSGTEAANLAIIGAALANDNTRRKRILLGAAEHHCVLHTASILQRLGYKVELIPVDRLARIRLDALEQMLSDDVLLVSVMHANNELGTMQPVAEVARVTHRHGALYHCDAVQTFLGSPWTVQDIDADLLTISAHKIHGPKGIGALYIRAGTMIKPLTTGGGQERELRAGTESVAGIVGFGEAVRQIPKMPDNRRAARDAFQQGLHSTAAIPSVANREDILPGHVHVRFPGIAAETMLILLDRLGVSASSGAACSSGSIEPSHVLLACGYSEEEAKEGLRFTFGHETSTQEATEAAARVIEAASQIRKGHERQTTEGKLRS